jgi:hypothetical protein
MKYNTQEPFSAAIIIELIQKQWFSETMGEGAMHRNAFDPMPMQIICLVSTTVSGQTISPQTSANTFIGAVCPRRMGARGIC